MVRHLKKALLWDNMTWSEIGKQNIQAKSKKFYCMLHFCDVLSVTEHVTPVISVIP